LAIVGVDLDKLHLICGHFIVRKDGIFWASCDTQVTIDAFVWVYNQEICALMEGVYRAFGYTRRMLASNTPRSHYICHSGISARTDPHTRKVKKPRVDKPIMINPSTALNAFHIQLTIKSIIRL
tara:strand:- start:3 stop:374 length:372 start_codon:yes stop_codon:yes gene_type:complete